MSDFIDTLFATIQDRQVNPRPGSYTNALLSAGEDEIVKKVGEEAVEIILAVKGQGKTRIIEETADLVYHLLVMLADQGLSWEEVRAELEKRHR